MAERRHRHVVETGLALLHYANLPLTFWSHAFQTAVYLINRLPTHTLQNQTPFYRLFKQSPNYTKLKPFGCLCYPWLRPYTTSKLHPRSSPCLFLGYSTSKSAYKCFDPQTRRLYHSRHVEFIESNFPSFHHSSSTQIPTSDDFLKPVPSAIPPLPTLSSMRPIHTNHNPLPIISATSPPPPSVHHSSPSQTPTSPSLSSSSPSNPQHNSNSPDPTSSATTELPNILDSIDTNPESSSNSPPPRHRKPNPKYYNSSFINSTTLHRIPPTLEPSTHHQALKDPNWRQAMDLEFNALMHNGTWELVPRASHQLIGCK